MEQTEQQPINYENLFKREPHKVYEIEKCNRHLLIMLG